jgi:hypothetical protein
MQITEEEIRKAFSALEDRRLQTPPVLPVIMCKKCKQVPSVLNTKLFCKCKEPDYITGWWVESKNAIQEENPFLQNK